MLTGNFAYHVDVGEMTENEGMALLKSKLHRKVAYTEDEAIELVKAAECMPLAISQIAARISADYPRFGLSQAIEKLKDPDQDTSRLLEGSVHESNRDVRRTNSIVKSWHMNFQYVQERNRSAARLFSLMCLFDRQDIPKALLAGHYGEEVTAGLAPNPRHLSLWKRIRRRSLRRHSKRTKENKGVINNSHSAFDDDWHVLNNLMLIKTSLDGCHFSMHRLIQHTTRRWLELNGEMQAWMQKHIMIMFQYFPKPSSDTWEVCDYLLPHAQQAVKYRPSDAPTLRLWAPLIHTLGQYVSSKGNKSAAEQLHRLALEGLLVVVGEHHEVTLRCLQNLGGEVNALRRPAEAEPIYRRAWEGRRALLGEDHVDTLQSANSLGSVLNSLKRYDEGDAMHARVIEGYERTFGPTHNETLTILSILQFGHAMDGRFDKCAELCRRTQVADKEIYGEESDEYLEHMQALGGLENLQGRHAEAEEILQEVVRLRVERFNYHHRDTIASINYLCDALAKQGKLDEALGWYRHVEDAYPDLDRKTQEAALESLDHLARVLAQLGQLGEAETLARYMIDERERLLEPDDSYTLLGYHTLADILTQREQLQSALDMYEKAYFGLRDMAGPVEDTNQFMNDYNAAKNRLLQWSGNEDRQPLDTCKPQEETVDSAPILAFQSPEPVFA
jgi:tetratricopeptide (TPR) repeat protein